MFEDLPAIKCNCLSFAFLLLLVLSGTYKPQGLTIKLDVEFSQRGSILVNIGQSREFFTLLHLNLAHPL